MVPLNSSNKQLFEVSIINIPRFKKNKIRSISYKYEKKEIRKKHLSNKRCEMESNYTVPVINKLECALIFIFLKILSLF